MTTLDLYTARTELVRDLQDGTRTNIGNEVDLIEEEMAYRNFYGTNR
jgi:hypothetical protein